MVGRQQGYVALIAVLIIGAAATAIGVALLATGTDSQRAGLVEQQTKQARGVAVACAEEALEVVHDNLGYTGSASIGSIGQGSCTYAVTSTGTSTRMITAIGTVSAVTQTVQVGVTIGSTTISISSWKESASTTPAFIQADGLTNDSGSTTIAKALPYNVVAGNTIIATATWDSSSTTTMTCSDTLGNSYTTINVWTDSVNTQSVGICYARVTTAGTDTVTATFGAGASFRRFIVSEYNGLAATSPVDVVAATPAGVSTTTTDAVTSGAAPTTQNGDLIYGVVDDTSASTTITAGTGFTQRFSLNGKDFVTQDRVQATAGSIASTQTFGTASQRYVAVMIAFKPGP